MSSAFWLPELPGFPGRAPGVSLPVLHQRMRGEYGWNRSRPVGISSDSGRASHFPGQFGNSRVVGWEGGANGWRKAGLSSNRSRWEARYFPREQYSFFASPENAIPSVGSNPGSSREFRPIRQTRRRRKGPCRLKVQFLRALRPVPARDFCEIGSRDIRGFRIVRCFSVSPGSVRSRATSNSGRVTVGSMGDGLRRFASLAVFDGANRGEGPFSTGSREETKNVYHIPEGLLRAQHLARVSLERFAQANILAPLLILLQSTGFQDEPMDSGRWS